MESLSNQDVESTSIQYLSSALKTSWSFTYCLVTQGIHAEVSIILVSTEINKVKVTSLVPSF